MNILILGPQASGKGTQAKAISEKLGLLHVESGELLRQKAKTDEKLRQILNSGALAPNEETVRIVDEFIKSGGRGYDNLMFDGFPRTADQYGLLKSWLQKNGASLNKVIYLEVRDSVSEERISSRRTCKVCGNVYNLVTNPPKNGDRCDCGGELIQREDDLPETVKKRLGIFHTQTEPILKLAQEDGILIKIDGEKSIAEVTSEILEKIS